MTRCSRCYGDVRGECIRVGFCIIDPPPPFSRLRDANGRQECAAMKPLPTNSMQAAPEGVGVTFGERVRQTRQARKMSLSQVAKIAECSKAYIWEIERGTKRPINPTVNLVYSLANALGVSPAFLLGFREAAPSTTSPANGATCPACETRIEVIANGAPDDLARCKCTIVSLEWLRLAILSTSPRYCCPCGGELTEYRLCKICGGDVPEPPSFESPTRQGDAHA